jgi:hypothetical protein
MQQINYYKNDIIIFKEHERFKNTFTLNRKYIIINVKIFESFISNNETILYHIMNDNNGITVFDHTNINDFFINITDIRRNKLNKIIKYK